MSNSMIIDKYNTMKRRVIIKRKEANIQRDVINIDINGSVSEHVLYSNEQSTSLVVVFPGANNNSLTPFLYYLRDYFVHNNYDLLAISYKNLVQRGDSSEEQMNKISFAVNQAIFNNGKPKTYENFIFVARSVGNVISNKIKNDYKINVIKSIYINPVKEALEDIQKDPGLIITASNDEHLDNENLKKLLNNEFQEVLVFEDGDHYLECEDTLESIEFCKKAVAKVIEFINK